MACACVRACALIYISWFFLFLEAMKFHKICYNYPTCDFGCYLMGTAALEAGAIPLVELDLKQWSHSFLLLKPCENVKG